jgi:serine-type D-Ala-D-Ala endopeptidase (penicillin-binding protein 7)
MILSRFSRRLLSFLILLLCAAFAMQVSAAQPQKKKPVASKQVKKIPAANKKFIKNKRGARSSYEPPSLGRLSGLHSVRDELDLKSSVALVVDQDTNEVLFSKNDSTVLPIASITKLMTGILVSEAGLAMNEVITITQNDVVGERGVRSRLKVGMQLTRQELMHLALMSSENRAAHALGRTYPGGLEAFIPLMNAKAQQLGMMHTRYVEPTGLSNENRSTAQDLAKLVSFASRNPEVSQYSVSHGYQLAAGNKTLQYVNTNRLTSNPTWDIGIQKTGYISSAGRCLVMQTKVAGRQLVMVFLDSMGKYSRLGDAERVRAWLEGHPQGKSHT